MKLLLFIALLLPSLSQAQFSKKEIKAMEVAYLDTLNQIRAVRNLPPFTYKHSRQAAVNWKARRLQKTFEHDKLGFKSEIINRGYRSTSESVDGFMTSKGHKASILSGFPEACVGIYYNKYANVYFVCVRMYGEPTMKKLNNKKGA